MELRVASDTRVRQSAKVRVAVTVLVFGFAAFAVVNLIQPKKSRTPSAPSLLNIPFLSERPQEGHTRRVLVKVANPGNAETVLKQQLSKTVRTVDAPIVEEVQSQLKDKGELPKPTITAATPVLRALRPVFRGSPTKNLQQWFVVELKDPIPKKSVHGLFKKSSDILSVEPSLLYTTEKVEFSDPGEGGGGGQLPANDPFYATAGSWGQTYDDLWGIKRINAPAGWGRISSQASTIVAVIDTGVDATHEDLQGQLWVNRREIAGNALDDDQNGFVDDTGGWDFVDNDAVPSDGHGHGTHVAGTIGAVNDNSIGVASVIPKVQLMAVKGLDDNGTGYWDDLAAAVYYAVRNGASVINMSWGGSSDSAAIRDALSFAVNQGVIPVASAGNANQDVALFFPASDPGVITVGAWSPADSRASFSNFGDGIDVVAPGVDILSLRAEGTDMYHDGTHVVAQHYLRANGTSMASPHIAGAAALLKTLVPSASSEMVAWALTSSAEDVGEPGKDTESGYGVGKPAQAAVQLEQAVTQPQPELHILSFTAKLQSDRQYHLNAVVRNSGFANSRSFEYAVRDARDPFATPLFEGQSSSLALNATTTLETTLPWSANGPVELLLVINSAHAVQEYSFENNQIKTDLNLLREGWPQETNTPHGLYGTAAVADLNADGDEEIVVGAMDWNVYVWRPDGTRYPQWPPSNGFSTGDFITLPTSLANIDADPEKEIIVVSNDYKVYAWDFNGSLVPGWPVFRQGVEGIIATGDLDGDGKDEVVVGNYLLGDLIVYRGDGTILPGWPKGGGVPYTSYYFPAIADINGDAQPDIIAADSAGNMFVWDKQGVSLPGWPITLDNGVSGGPLLVNVMGDVRPEIFVGTFAGTLYGFAADGSTLPGWPRSLGDGSNFHGIYGPPSAGNMTGDDTPEIAVGTYDDKMHVLLANGDPAPGWPKFMGSEASAISLWGTPTLADINNNGYDELFIGSRSGKIYAWQPNGTDLPGWPQETDEVIDWGSVATAPIIADLENDGMYELIVGNDWNSKMFVFEIPQSIVGERNPWPTFHQNNHRTGTRTTD